jgi:hypothetical protein
MSATRSDRSVLGATIEVPGPHPPAFRLRCLGALGRHEAHKEPLSTTSEATLDGLAKEVEADVLIAPRRSVSPQYTIFVFRRSARDERPEPESLIGDQRGSDTNAPDRSTRSERLTLLTAEPEGSVECRDRAEVVRMLVEDRIDSVVPCLRCWRYNSEHPVENHKLDSPHEAEHGEGDRKQEHRGHKMAEMIGYADMACHGGGDNREQETPDCERPERRTSRRQCERPVFPQTQLRLR